MLSDAVIILANMRGSYINVGSTVHTLFRMSGRRPPSAPNVDGGENIDRRSESKKRLAATATYFHEESAGR